LGKVQSSFNQVLTSEDKQKDIKVENGDITTNNESELNFSFDNCK